VGSERGADVFRQLRNAAERSRGRVQDAARDLQGADEHAEKLLAQRAEVFQELARHYLPDLERAEEALAFREVRDEIEEIRAERTGRMARLATELAAAQQQREALESELDRTTRALDEQVRRRQELEEQVASRLIADGDFQLLARSAATAEQALALDEERVDEIAREAADKLPAYEGSRLFTYLLDRKYGTSEYTARGFTRWADRKVAALIDYDRAREGYEFLRKTPELVRLEMERRREEFDMLMEEVEARQETVAADVGLPAVLAEGDRLGTLRDEQVAHIAEQEAAYGRLSEELASVEGAQGAFYQKALVRLRAFLESAERWVLGDRARRTPERADDELVREIRSLDRDIDRARSRVKELAEARAQREVVAVDLERLVQRFRQAEFDSARSRFDRLDLDDALDDFYDGDISAEELWRRIQRDQEFEAVARRAPHGFDVGDIGDILNSSGGRVLTNVLGSVLGSALGNAAVRSVRRRSSGWPTSSGGSSSWPSSSWGTGGSSRSRSSGGSSSGGSSSGSSGRWSGGTGFTRGDGF